MQNVYVLYSFGGALLRQAAWDSPSEATAQVALGFVDELEKADAHIARHPASGSPRYAHQLGLAGLRFWPLGRYPCLIFHVGCDEHIDVWRVLHAQRDIPAWMNEA